MKLKSYSYRSIGIVMLILCSLTLAACTTNTPPSAAKHEMSCSCCKDKKMSGECGCKVMKDCPCCGGGMSTEGKQSMTCMPKH